MLTMSIFLSLSIIFVIITILYLNNKKKSISKNMRNENEAEIQKNNKNTKKQLKDILKVKIKDSIIFYNNRYSSIIKLGNIDYNMLSEDEQEGIESVLIQTVLAIDYPIQFFSTTEYIDTSKVIKNIRENNASNMKIKEYQNNLISYLENLMNNRNISVVKNYAIISYDGYYENAIDELNRQVTSFKGSLLRAKIQCEVLTENDLYNLIYRELNKNSSVKVDLLKEGCENLYVRKNKKVKKERN